ncbi:MAG: hypothetical protein R6U57_13415 [Anaerolineales bacterium]
MNTIMLTPTLTYLFAVNREQEVIKRAKYAQLLKQCPRNKRGRKMNLPLTSIPLMTKKVKPEMKKQGALSAPKTLKTV